MSTNRVRIKVKGVKSCIHTTKKFEKAKIREIQRCIVKYAELIKSAAQADAPVDEGNLRESITVIYGRNLMSA